MSALNLGWMRIVLAFVGCASVQVDRDEVPDIAGPCRLPTPEASPTGFLPSNVPGSQCEKRIRIDLPHRLCFFQAYADLIGSDHDDGTNVFASGVGVSISRLLACIATAVLELESV